MTDFPNAVPFDISSTQVLIIGGFITLALIGAVIAFGVLWSKDKVSASDVLAHRKYRKKKIGLVLGIATIAGLCAGAASFQWSSVESPYLKEKAVAEAQMDDMFKLTGAHVVDDSYSVKEGTKSTARIAYEGSVLFCDVDARSSEQPIEVQCSENGGDEDGNGPETLD